MKFEELNELTQNWEYYVDNRNPFSFGDEQIDLDDFRELVKKTFEVIKQAKQTYIYRNCLPEDVLLTFEYLDLLSVFSQYKYYDNMEDESTDKIFTATCLVARALRNFAVYFDSCEYKENKREYFIDDETAAGNLFLRRDDFPFYLEEISDEELNKSYRYNVYNCDFTEFIELANSLI